MWQISYSAEVFNFLVDSDGYVDDLIRHFHKMSQVEDLPLDVWEEIDEDIFRTSAHGHDIYVGFEGETMVIEVIKPFGLSWHDRLIEPPQ